MKDKYYENLLELYWEGESSLEQEKELRKYFSGKDVPEYLEIYRDHMLFPIHVREEQKLSSEFDKKVLERIKPVRRQINPGRGRIMNLPAWWKMAAVIIATIGLFYLVQAPVNNKYSASLNEENDPEKAYRETKQALLLVSDRLNDGARHLSYLGKFDDARNTIDETLKTK